MDLDETLQILNEKDGLLLRIGNLDKEKAALHRVADLGFEVDDNLSYVNSTTRFVWSLVGLFIILYAMFLDRRFENIEIWNGFFVIGIIVLCVYVSVLLLNHYRGKTLLMTHSQIRASLKEIESRREEATRKERAIKTRMMEVEQEQLELLASVGILERLLKDSVVPLKYRQTSTVKHFKKNIDNLRAKKLSDAIRIYNEEKKHH